jgi:hypothetical protein
VHGDVIEKTMPMMQAAIAQNNSVQAKNLQQTVDPIASTNSEWYG